RLLSLMASSCMSRRARTLPTPGRDSRTLTTFSLASVSSRSPCSNSSARLSELALSFSFTSARCRRATAAFSSAAWRCSGVSEGGRGIGNGPPTQRAVVLGWFRPPRTSAPCSAAQPDDGVSIGSGLARATGRAGRALARACSTRKGAGGVARDLFRGALGVGGRGHRPTDDEPVSPLPERHRRRRHPGLVVSSLAGKTDAGHHRRELHGARLHRRDLV